MLDIDAALDGPFEQLGKLIVASGQEDSSGFRRALSSRLAKRDFEMVARSLGIEVSQAEELRMAFAEAYGEPS